MKPMTRVARLWSSAALVVFNVLVILLILNGISWLWLRRFDEPQRELPSGAVERRSGAPLKPVFPELTEAEITQLVDETWSRTHAYEPLTGHTERPFRGRFVNVDEHGYRWGRRQAVWPPPPASVFVFGGSTTFGMGVPDASTIPAQLEEMLQEALGREVHVYNFGRGYYYSSQERALFGALLESNIVPAIAVFIDGLNEFILAEPSYSQRLRLLVDEPQRPRSAVTRMPLVSVLQGFLTDWRIRDLPDDTVQRPAADLSTDRVLERYLLSKRMIKGMASQFGVQVLFVWQPVPTYRYDLRNHLYATRSNWLQNSGPRTRDGYAAFAARLAGEAPDTTFLWLADLQEGLAEPLYVDQVHYTVAMSRRIAAEIAKPLLIRLAPPTRGVGGTAASREVSTRPGDSRE